MQVMLAIASALLVSGTTPEAPATTKVTKALATYRDEKRWGANSCSHSYDGDCDDGGLGSEYSLCHIGTDESDCGDDSCSHRRDGDCDDGGPGAEFSLCMRNTDRSDCYMRRGGSFSIGSCSNSCSHDRDGDCDDGGFGAEFSLCHIGTDCADCGMRTSAFLRAEAAAIDSRVFPSVREQKLAKVERSSSKVQSAFAIGGLASVGLLAVAALLIKNRRAAPATAVPTADAKPPAMI
jgi:hypothetical protein